MNHIHLMSNDEREVYFRTAANEMEIDLHLIEKDFWVVWILERLFSLEKLKSHLTFKGGTSLSKIYRVIERFSEDIDITIDKDILGYAQAKNPESNFSNTELKKAIKKIPKACSDYIQGTLLTDLQENIASKLLTTENWKLYLDPDDEGNQTLLFKYPGNSSEEKYNKPQVKIEFGALNEGSPSRPHKIQSYVKEILKAKVSEEEIIIQVLDAERTFWEKATIHPS